jgi:hypothetical protein
MARPRGNPAPKPKVLGHNVRLINMSGVDKFCEYSGLKLPKRGFAWEHAGHLFMSRQAAEAWDAEENA